LTDRREEVDNTMDIPPVRGYNDTVTTDGHPEEALPWLT
jgi:hypothetical protein